MNVYEITTEYEKITSLLETLEKMKAAGEDVKDFEADTYKYLTDLKGNLYDKMDSISKIVKNYTALAASRKEEAKRLSESATAMEKKVDYLKEHLMKPLLVASGTRKLECKTFTVSFHKSYVVDVTNINKLPMRFLKSKETVTVDKKTLKTWIKAGNETDGAEIVARDTVQIK